MDTSPNYSEPNAKERGGECQQGWHVPNDGFRGSAISARYMQALVVGRPLRPPTRVWRWPIAHAVGFVVVRQVSEWPAIKDLSVELEPFASLYSITNDFGLRREEWLFGPVRDLNAEEVEASVADWFKKVRRRGRTVMACVWRCLCAVCRAAGLRLGWHPSPRQSTKFSGSACRDLVTSTRLRPSC